MGRLVGWCDRRFNRGNDLRLKGSLVTLGLLVAGLGIGGLIHILPDFGILEILTVAVLLAQKSLVDHVRAVATALRLSLIHI